MFREPYRPAPRLMDPSSPSLGQIASAVATTMAANHTLAAVMVVAQTHDGELTVGAYVTGMVDSLNGARQVMTLATHARKTAEEFLLLKAEGHGHG